jgi:hypothetical protein
MSNEKMLISRYKSDPIGNGCDDEAAIFLRSKYLFHQIEEGHKDG